MAGATGTDRRDSHPHTGQPQTVTARPKACLRMNPGYRRGLWISTGAITTFISAPHCRHFNTAGRVELSTFGSIIAFAIVFSHDFCSSQNYLSSVGSRMVGLPRNLRF